MLNPNDNDLIIKLPKSEKKYRVTNYKAKVSYKEARASNVLLCNVRLNNKTDNRRKRAGRTKQDEMGDGTERAKTRVGKRQQSGRDGNTERATHDETGDKTDGKKCQATGAQRGGKTDGPNGKVRRVAWIETGRGERTGKKRATNERGGGEVLCQQTTTTTSNKQTSLNSRTNLSHNLGKRRNATAQVIMVLNIPIES